jgi:hypothetical protein
MTLIGLNGFKTAGKDTVYGFIRDYYQAADTITTVQRVGFADKLKVVAYDALFKHIVSPLEQIAGRQLGAEDKISFINDNKEAQIAEDINVREFLQNLGQAGREHFGETFWIEQALSEDILAQADLTVVTDVRYPNEAQHIKDLGGTVWWVDRPGLESDGHASEQPLPEDLIDCVVDNSGSLDDLREHVYRLASGTSV